MSTPDKSTKPSDRHQCSQDVRSGWHSYGCQKTATVERAGRWYCGIHDPLRIEQRAEKRRFKNAEHDQRSAAIRAEGEQLLKALGITGRVDFDRDYEHGGYGNLRRVIIEFDQLKNLIAKAEGR